MSQFINLTDDLDDASISATDIEDSSSEALSNDDETFQPTSRSLGLSKFYIPDWTTTHAFRELYQNW